MSTNEKAKPTFEQLMTRLEEIVRMLEQGDVPLDKSLKLFEEGSTLARKCNEFLDKAEQKVTKLTGSGEGKGEPFTPEEQGGV